MSLSLFAFGVDQSIEPAADQSAIDLTPSKAAVAPVMEMGPVVREGTHLVSRTGRLTRSTDNQQMWLTFDDSVKTTPMIVVPNLNLFAMESVAAVKGTAVQFYVSGTVSEYKGRNYILLDKAQTTRTTVAAIPKSVAIPVTKVETKPVATTTKATETKAVNAITPGSSAQEQTMNRLLAPAPTMGQPLPPPASNQVPTTDRSTGTAAVAPSAPVLTVIREGTHLINRVGRLSHTPDGRQAILTFDSDGKPMKDPPMVILPNLKLETMEQSVLNRSSDSHFRVSGVITEYKGRNYIQLDKAVLMADIETQF